MALIADARRLTSAEAAVDTDVLRINRSMFRRILEEYPETAEALRDRIIEDLQALIRKIEAVGERLG
jgi:CRP-like cAMP-binding protein